MGNGAEICLNGANAVVATGKRLSATYFAKAPNSFDPLVTR
jgi:hypothetical protein